VSLSSLAANLPMKKSGDMEQLTDNVYLHTVPFEGYTITGAVVVAQRRAFVIDTLISPQAVQPVKELLADVAPDRRVVVIDTHHHYDHVYGNAAFSGSDIVAHRLCPRLIREQSHTSDESVPPEPPEGVPLPTITFGDRLTYVDGDTTLHLIHTPGHSEDSIVVYDDGQRILFAGDTVEWPLPEFCQRDGYAPFVKTLRQLKQLPIDKVVPGHGPVTGKEIIDANQRYVEGIYEAVRAARENAVSRHQLELPAEWFLPGGVTLDATYLAAHKANVEWAYDDA